jgi:7,8-dihydropterin-6-yl-methyl-4-(beta-D-ribofuranosyl)aminobenzene 5'-phosphate synthase
MGWNPSSQHMKKLNIYPNDIKRLVLSHQHWDHIGGLPEILQANPEIKVYVLRPFLKT